MIPLRYVLRSLGQRKLRTIMTVLGVALVVAVYLLRLQSTVRLGLLRPGVLCEKLRFVRLKWQKLNLSLTQT